MINKNHISTIAQDPLTAGPQDRTTLRLQDPQTARPKNNKTITL